MPEKKHPQSEKSSGSMTVEEAGRLGGHKGGQRERELVEKGHQVEERREGQVEQPRHEGGQRKGKH